MPITALPQPFPEPLDEPTPPRPTLAPGAKGTAVRDAQEDLLRAGYSLTRYGADGHYGRETSAAVTRFQRAIGLPATGRLDERTLRALETAPSRAPEYDALFADGVLRVSLAVGFDEANAHEPELDEVLRGLQARGYAWLTDAQKRARDLPLDGRYLTRALGEATVLLELISPDTPRAKERFATAMRGSEVVLYGGHGRYGSGPDFDALDSPRGNFVIGAPYEAGHVTLGANDLAAAPLTRDYQLLFFDGCSTFRYFDDLRARTPGKSTANLDLIGSTTELFWNVTAENLLAMLDGISRREDLASLTSSLDEVNGTGNGAARPYFRGDGFEDN